eukprot:3940845-Rhodomonas_salina.1
MVLHTTHPTSAHRIPYFSGPEIRLQGILSISYIVGQQQIPSEMVLRTINGAAALLAAEASYYLRSTPRILLPKEQRNGSGQYYVMRYLHSELQYG